MTTMHFDSKIAATLWLGHNGWRLMGNGNWEDRNHMHAADIRSDSYVDGWFTVNIWEKTYA